MVQNPPEGYPRVSPYLLYEDAEAAVEWLTSAFGFTEKLRMPGPDGGVAHAELQLGESVIMLGTPQGDFKSPRQLGGTPVSIYAYVDDVDEHFARAQEAGATIKQEPADQFYGDRTYMAEDPEGHAWGFATHVRDVTPEEMAAAVGQATA